MAQPAFSVSLQRGRAAPRGKHLTLCQQLWFVPQSQVGCRPIIRPPVQYGTKRAGKNLQPSGRLSLLIDQRLVLQTEGLEDVNRAQSAITVLFLSVSPCWRRWEYLSSRRCGLTPPTPSSYTGPRSTDAAGSVAVLSPLLLSPSGPDRLTAGSVQRRDSRDRISAGPVPAAVGLRYALSSSQRSQPMNGFLQRLHRAPFFAPSSPADI